MRKARLNDDIGLLCLHELVECSISAVSTANLLKESANNTNRPLILYRSLGAYQEEKYMIEWMICVQHARVCNIPLFRVADSAPRSTKRQNLCFPTNHAASWLLQLTSKEMVSVPCGLISYPVLSQDQSVQRANRFERT